MSNQDIKYLDSSPGHCLDRNPGRSPNRSRDSEGNEELPDGIEEISLEAISASADRIKSTLSVTEMGRLLGLKKTDSYYLVNKRYFETVTIGRKTRVVIESFEKWYANQVRYKKVNGNPPGAELKEKSLSAGDIALELGIDEASAYELIKKEHLPTELVYGWRRVPREAFGRWYERQKHYRTLRDREIDDAKGGGNISMPEMARCLGVHRRTVYDIIRKDHGRTIETVMVGDRRHVTKRSFEAWLAKQTDYQLLSGADRTELPDEIQMRAEEELRKLEEVRKTLRPTAPGNASRAEEFLSPQEAAAFAGVNRNTMGRWIREGKVQAVRVGSSYRVRKQSLEAWLAEREEKYGDNRAEK